MTGRNDNDGTTADVWLFNVIGLHGILHGGRACRRAFFAVLCVSFGVHAVQIAWLPAALHDFQRFAYTAVMLAYGLMTSLKGMAVVRNAARLRSVLDVARLTYTRCGRRSPGPMYRCRSIVSRLLRTMVALCYGTYGFWTAVPWLVRERVTVTHADGTVGHYRATVNNIWFPMPEAVHNSPAGWAAIYSVEAVVGLADVVAWMMFDCYLVTVCFVLDVQFCTVSAGYATLGRRRCGSPPPSDSSPADIRLKIRDVQLHSDDIEMDHYDNLISHIQDNQNIIIKFDEFFDVIRPLIILQILISSFSVTSFTLFISLMIYLGQPVVSVTFFKFVGGLLLLITELFICCYGFNLIESAKSKLNFGLYKCNWTEMDLKFKKIMVMAMAMNSAHKRVMKVSPNSIIHLEMFTDVLRMALSMVSVLLNLNK